MNVTKFLRESARFMAKDRPDIWSERTAFETLTRWYADLMGETEDGEISTGGFALSKREYDGIIEYELSRKVATFTIFQEENVTDIMDWTTNGTLVNIGLDLEDVEE